jgi:hypothetical protein
MSFESTFDERTHRMSTFDSTKRRLVDLLRDIEAGKIQLPDFQRGWVWDDEHIRSLLISIARAFPVGAVMLLETGGEARFKVRPVEGIDPATIPATKVEKLILDGQQRLKSLTQVLILDKAVKTRDEKKRPVERFYYIDIERAMEGPESYEQAIVAVGADRTIRGNFGKDITLDLRTEEQEFKNFYFPCNQILNRNKWESGLIAFAPDKFAKYMQFRDQVLDRFTDYDVPVIELKKDNKTVLQRVRSFCRRLRLRSSLLRLPISHYVQYDSTAQSFHLV